MENKTETKIYKVLDKNGLYEYNLQVINDGDVTTFTLYTNDGEQWTNSNKNVPQLTMVDDGDEIKFNKNIKKMDYCTLLYLRIIINFAQETSSNVLNRAKHQVVLSELILNV